MYLCTLLVRKMNNVTDKTPLLGMSLGELKILVKELGMSAFTGGQIAQWIYQKRIHSIDEMTNLSKKIENALVRTIV